MTNATRNGSSIKIEDLATAVKPAIEVKSDTPTAIDEAKLNAKIDSLIISDAVDVEARFVKSVGIQYLAFDDLKRIVEYRADHIFLMNQTGSNRILLGRMTVDGIERDTKVRLTSTIQKIIDSSNRKWSYASKEKAELTKTEKLNKARLELDELFA